jgi:hypothetical protein
MSSPFITTGTTGDNSQPVLQVWNSSSVSTMTTDGNGEIDCQQLTTNSSNVKIGNNAGVTGQGATSVAVGNSAGNSTQGNLSVAIGNYAGEISQASNSVAIGYLAGAQSQGTFAVAVGNRAAMNTQSTGAVALGDRAGENSQGESAVAIGKFAGTTGQASQSVSIGFTAAPNGQSFNSIAIGAFSGTSGGLPKMGTSSVAIGASALAEGEQATSVGNQASAVGDFSVSIGRLARCQGDNSVAIGSQAGNATTAIQTIAIGSAAAVSGQGISSIAIGTNSGADAGQKLGDESIAIGTRAIAEGTDCIAVGTSASTSTFNNCAVFGQDAECTTNQQVMLGSAAGLTTFTEVVPGLTNTTNLGSHSNQFLNLYLSSFQQLSDISTPSSPSLGTNRLYFRSGHPFMLNSAVSEEARIGIVRTQTTTTVGLNPSLTPDVENYTNFSINFDAPTDFTLNNPVGGTTTPYEGQTIHFRVTTDTSGGTVPFNYGSAYGNMPFVSGTPINQDMAYYFTFAYTTGYGNQAAGWSVTSTTNFSVV